MASRQLGQETDYEFEAFRSSCGRSRRWQRSDRVGCGMWQRWKPSTDNDNHHDHHDHNVIDRAAPFSV